jgi:hypothetical protein
LKEEKEKVVLEKLAYKTPYGSENSSAKHSVQEREAERCICSSNEQKDVCVIDLTHKESPIRRPMNNMINRAIGEKNKEIMRSISKQRGLYSEPPCKNKNG